MSLTESSHSFAFKVAKWVIGITVFVVATNVHLLQSGAASIGYKIALLAVSILLITLAIGTMRRHRTAGKLMAVVLLIVVSPGLLMWGLYPLDIEHWISVSTNAPKTITGLRILEVGLYCAASIAVAYVGLRVWKTVSKTI